MSNTKPVASAYAPNVKTISVRGKIHTPRSQTTLLRLKAPPSRVQLLVRRVKKLMRRT